MCIRDRVLALSGGFSFKKSEFNRATQALRQPGSAFKPFVYALALENNYTPTSLILDAPIVLDQGEDLKMWKPENYGKKFYGPSTLRVGLEKSRNLMTVRIAQDLGLKKIINFSENLGINDNPEELLSISLGSAETTLLKLTSAYSVFVNGGKLVDPIIMVLILNIPSFVIGSLFYILKRKLFWIFYGITFFLISSIFIIWTAIEIYTGSDWGKIL